MTSNIINNRYEFVYLFDVKSGNPNGDPDAGNLPRTDPETGHGLVTDVCLKRKIRNYIELTKTLPEGGKPEVDMDMKDAPPRCEIFVKERGILANEQKRAFKAVKAEPSESANLEARSWMCKNYADVRWFGAVMTTGKAPMKDDDDKVAKKEKKLLWNCGQVRGPVQICFARSIDPILALEHSITRCALTNPGDTDRDSVDEEGEEKAGSGQMGRKNTVPYALYRAHGFISPHFAHDTGFTEDDLTLLWAALSNMFDHDHSASRGEMHARKLIIFKHESALGNAPSHTLFDSVQVKRKDVAKPPRSFEDYQVTIDKGSVPSGVTIDERL